MLALQIGIDGSFERVDLNTIDVEVTLDTLQAAVGGYIERIPCPSYDMYVNADGQQLRLERNHIASELVATMRGDLGSTEILGNVILTGKIVGEDITALDADSAAFLHMIYGSYPI